MRRTEATVATHRIDWILPWFWRLQTWTPVFTRYRIELPQPSPPLGCKWLGLNTKALSTGHLHHRYEPPFGSFADAAQMSSVVGLLLGHSACSGLFSPLVGESGESVGALLGMRGRLWGSTSA